LPALPARATTLTLGFAVAVDAIPLALVIGGRSLPLHDGSAAAAAIDTVQLEALRCLSQQLCAARGQLTDSRGHAELMRTERDDARRATARAEAAAYDATARAGAAADAGGARMRPLRRPSPRAAAAACVVSSTALAVAILGWPARDGTRESGVAGVAAASPAVKHAKAPAATAPGARAAADAELARRLRIPADYLALYRRSGVRYGLDWTRLAAVGAIESTHGQARSAGVATGANARGALGPAQFLGGTWERFGLDGDANGTRDAHDPADAIPAMASYLRASGAPQDWRAALRAYNHSDAYVDAVEDLATRYRERVRRGAAR
ncbi:MAG: hypothetical protein QOE31_2757, partial [Solirubrobacteraceae bacterium]|nr:hypothetical protein [Solirubrobacteraceae bacterium]